MEFFLTNEKFNHPQQPAIGIAWEEAAKLYFWAEKRWMKYVKDLNYTWQKKGMSI